MEIRYITLTQKRRIAKILNNSRSIYLSLSLSAPLASTTLSLIKAPASRPDLKKNTLIY